MPKEWGGDPCKLEQRQRCWYIDLGMDETASLFA